MTDFQRPNTRTQELEVKGVDCTAAVKHLAEMGTTQVLTATGDIDADKHVVELTHASAAIAATIADMTTHGPGLVIITDTTTGATHTVTLTAGTFDGTNNKITLNAAGESLTVQVDADGSGTVVSNLGGVALSTV